MQNKYFGDVGDFTKYALLRLMAPGVGRLGILWYLAENEGFNNDGKHLAYLEQPAPNAYSACDPELYRALKGCLFDGQGNLLEAERNVSHMKGLGLLPADTTYFTDILRQWDGRERVRERSLWFQKSLKALEGCETVFCDPDNGINPKRMTKRNKRHYKYVFCDELRRIWEGGSSLVVYQHMHRARPHAAQVAETRARLGETLNTDAVIAVRCPKGTVRTYYLVPQARHRERFGEAAAKFTKEPWDGHAQLWP